MAEMVSMAFLAIRKGGRIIFWPNILAISCKEAISCQEMAQKWPKNGNVASLYAFLATVKTIFSRMRPFFEQPVQMSAYGQFCS